MISSHTGKIADLCSYYKGFTNPIFVTEAAVYGLKPLKCLLYRGGIHIVKQRKLQQNA